MANTKKKKSTKKRKAVAHGRGTWNIYKESDQQRTRWLIVEPVGAKIRSVLTCPNVLAGQALREILFEAEVTPLEGKKGEPRLLRLFFEPDETLLADLQVVDYATKVESAKPFPDKIGERLDALRSGAVSRVQRMLSDSAMGNNSRLVATFDCLTDTFPELAAHFDLHCVSLALWSYAVEANDEQVIEGANEDGLSVDAVFRVLAWLEMAHA